MKREARTLNSAKLSLARKSYRETHFPQAPSEGTTKEEPSGEWRRYVEIAGAGHATHLTVGLKVKETQ